MSEITANITARKIDALLSLMATDVLAYIVNHDDIKVHGQIARTTLVDELRLKKPCYPQRTNNKDKTWLNDLIMRNLEDAGHVSSFKEDGSNRTFYFLTN